MPRPPKQKVVVPAVEIPAKPAAVVVPAGPPRVIDVDNFIRVRDSVYQRLSTIQDLIKSFSQDYLRQTNLLLGEGTNLENGGEFDLQQQLGGNLFAGFVTQMPQVEEKKERKKRTHDPNAPKRPLTPYFLYMQTARPIIANDLGEEAPKGAVQEEGQRRWSVMGAQEKAGWNTAYQYNLRLYNARVHSYKHGNPNAKSMTDDEALKYADEFGIEAPTAAVVEDAAGSDQDAIAQQLQQSAPVEASEEEEEQPTPAAKTPKKAAATTRKRKTATPAAAEAEVSKVQATPASPEVKKRKRTSKAAEMEEPKKSGRKKSKA